MGNHIFENARKAQENVASSVLINQLWTVCDRIFWVYVCNLSFFHLSVGEMRQLNMSNKWKLCVSFTKYLVPFKEWYVPALYKGLFCAQWGIRGDQFGQTLQMRGLAWLLFMFDAFCHMVHLVGGHSWWSAFNPSKALLWEHKLGQSLDIWRESWSEFPIT